MLGDMSIITYWKLENIDMANFIVYPEVIARVYTYFSAGTHLVYSSLDGTRDALANFRSNYNFGDIFYIPIHSRFEHARILWTFKASVLVC